MPAYSFMDVQATLVGPGGNINLGFGASNAKEGITIKMDENKNTKLLGADGNGMNSLHASKSGTVECRYLKTSPVNSQLMALYDFQSQSASVWGQNIITVSQTAAGDIHTCRECAFQKKPDITYAEDGDVMVWVFDSIKVDGLLGTY